MAAKKCTHPKGYDKVTRRCPICKALKRGPRPKAKVPVRPLRPTVVPPVSTDPSDAPAVSGLPDASAPTADGTTERARRLSALFPAFASPEPEPGPEPEGTEDIEISQDEPETDEPDKAEFGYDWKWTAKKLITGLDIACGIAIDKLTDREPLDAGEDEINELERVTAEYGEKKIGKIEAPLWLVFLIALAFFVLSKYSGAPRKPQLLAPARKPARDQPKTPSNTTRPAAGTADTSIPDTADAAVTPEIPRLTPPPPVATDGSVGGAMVGF